MNTNQVIILIGRENLEKDSHLHRDVFAKLKEFPLTVFFDPNDQIRRAINHPIFKKIPSFLRKNLWLRKMARLSIIFFFFLKHGQYDLIHLKSFRAKSNNLDLRIWALTEQLKKLNHTTQITLIGRSAGAIVATKASLLFPIHQIICLGYPFKHPDEQEEAFRTEHLALVNTPTLIIQGERDVYGGKEIMGKYALNQATKVIFQDLDHDLTLNETSRLKLISQLRTYLKRN